MAKKRRKTIRMATCDFDAEVVEGDRGPAVRVAVGLAGSDEAGASAVITPGTAIRIGQALIDVGRIAQEGAAPDRN